MPEAYFLSPECLFWACFPTMRRLKAETAHRQGDIAQLSGWAVILLFASSWFRVT
jgi:hypothetical protein